MSKESLFEKKVDDGNGGRHTERGQRGEAGGHRDVRQWRHTRR